MKKAEQINCSALINLSASLNAVLISGAVLIKVEATGRIDARTSEKPVKLTSQLPFFSITFGGLSRHMV